VAADDASVIASAILDARAEKRQREPFTAADPGFSLADAYAVTAELRRMRVARGERPAGRKIGFTNRNIWAEYSVFEPIWGDIYDSGVQTLEPGGAIGVGHLPEPRIEPEIVLGIERDLSPGMGLPRDRERHRLGGARLRDRAVDLSGLALPRRRLRR
jgi:2-oxo-3-hexenedioate decarboxylase